MSNKEKFISDITSGYTFQGASMVLGAAMLDTQTIDGLQVKAPLKTFNRHGLIAGATGTGKTKTLQHISGELAKNGVSVLLMDIKGDLSGLAKPGVTNPKIEERVQKIGAAWAPHGFSSELMTISNQDGVRLRATVSEFGPVLLSKILELNDVQGGVIALIFKFCDNYDLPLLDLKDLKKVLQYASNEGKAEIEKEFGAISPATVGTILRKVVELESQGAEAFFGETSFDTNDLLRKDENGNGYINIIRLNDIQDKPKLFSTFMLSILSEIYQKMPERGDIEVPELVIFIDEAHLVFNEASKALLQQLESIIKLIRSKGVGIFFCTQNPIDIPDSILSQLGMKIQHALRAFTAKDREAIKKAAENYPVTDHYDIDETLTILGIGEAFVSVLNEKGIPTPLVQTLMFPPVSRMDIITEDEKRQILSSSRLYAKYGQIIDRDSAYEMLVKKIEAATADQAQENAELAERKAAQKPLGRQEKSTFEKVIGSTTTRQIGRTVAREITRGLLGVLGLGGKGKKWF